MATLRVRVLCDGCERSVADVYCGKCKAASCKKCKARLHANCHAYDLSNSSAVLALCVTCRQRPAHRKSLNECIECRDSKRTRAHHHHHHHRSSGKTGSSRSSRQRVGPHAAVRKTRRHSPSSGNDTSTEGDIGGFSRESSAE